jgi:cell division protein FtsB
MAAIKPRNDPVRLLWRRLFMFGLIVLVLFGMWAVWDVLLKERESRALRLRAEAQLDDLQAREEGLKARISSLETDRGQEAALRNAYEVGKQGESMITIVDEAAPTSTPSVPAKNQGSRKWFWWW